MTYEKIQEKLIEIKEEITKKYQTEENNNKYVNVCYVLILQDLDGMIGFFKAQEFKSKNNFKFYRDAES